LQVREAEVWRLLRPKGSFHSDLIDLMKTSRRRGTEERVEWKRGWRWPTCGMTRYLPEGRPGVGGANTENGEGYSVAASLLQLSESTLSCSRRPANVDVTATMSRAEVEAWRCFARPVGAVGQNQTQREGEVGAAARLLDFGASQSD
jgi:hypothetical protein